MERVLYNLGVPLSPLQFWVAVGAVTIVLGVLLYTASPSHAPLALLVPPAVFIFLLYLHGRKIRKIREEFPRFVHFLSTHPSLTLREVIRLGADGFGELSKEMKGAWKIVEGGGSPARALRGFSRRMGDEEIERIVEGLLVAFRSGRVGEYLKNLSEELYFTQELENERRGALSLQRYSIVFSAAVLVPFILGLVVSMVESLGGGKATPLHLIPPYLVILSFISGSFLALTEGRPKNAPFYILLTVATSLSTYWVVLWLY